LSETIEEAVKRVINKSWEDEKYWLEVSKLMRKGIPRQNAIEIVDKNRL